MLRRALKELIEVDVFAALNPLAYCFDLPIHRKCHNGRTVSISSKPFFFLLLVELHPAWRLTGAGFDRQNMRLIGVSCFPAGGQFAMGSTASRMYTVFRFGPFELSERDGELRKNGVRIKLQEQPFRVLIELLANAGTVVTRRSCSRSCGRLTPSLTSM